MIICADDFGLRPEYDRAILELARHGRISAVSVMTATLSGAPDAIAALRVLRGIIDIGLHLVLTDGDGAPLIGEDGLQSVPGRFYRFGALLRRAYCERLPLSAVRAEIAAQIRRFCEWLGAPPDFIDGHLHIQQLPGIREAVADFAAELCQHGHCYVRHANFARAARLPAMAHILKQAAIAWPGKALCDFLKAKRVPTNRRFFGIYHYRYWQDFPAYLQRWCTAADHPNDLLMVHPGCDGGWRELEFKTLLAAVEIPVNRFVRGG